MGHLAGYEAAAVTHRGYAPYPLELRLWLQGDDGEAIELEHIFYIDKGFMVREDSVPRFFHWKSNDVIG